MRNVRLNIVHNAGRTGSPRLCDSCDYGLVMRGDGQHAAYCNYVREFVTIDVTECNRYVVSTLNGEETGMHLLAHYTLD